jgi:hypothetical protein
VSIHVPEQKVKPRKGHNLSWRREPVEVSHIRTAKLTEEIQSVEADNPLWLKMAGRLPPKQTKECMPPESHNRFASLLADEDITDQLHNPHPLS